MKYLTILLLIVLCAGHAWSQSEATQLAEQDFKKCDAELNSVYKEVLSKIPNDQLKADFRKAQAAWIKFRDAEAQFRTGLSSQGGSTYSTDYLAYLSELTEQRTKELKKALMHLRLAE